MSSRGIVVHSLGSQSKGCSFKSKPSPGDFRQDINSNFATLPGADPGGGRAGLGHPPPPRQKKKKKKRKERKRRERERGEKGKERRGRRIEKGEEGDRGGGGLGGTQVQTCFISNSIIVDYK